VSSLRQAGRVLLLFVLVCLLAGSAIAQALLPGISVSEAKDGIRIRIAGGAVGNPRILRLSNPERLALDFDNTYPALTSADRAKWKTRGVRIAFHPESKSTRFVFDMAAGEQRWLKREGGVLVVQTESQAVRAGSDEPRKAAARGKALVPVAVTGAAMARPERVSKIRQAGTPKTVPQVAVPQAVTAAEPNLRVTSQNGLIAVSARGVPFKAILTEIASSTGASLQLLTPVEGAKAEVFEFGPATPMEVLRKLFEGSQYNYLVVSEPNNGDRISRIVVTSTLRQLPGNDGPAMDDDTNPEALSGIAPLAPQTKQAQPVTTPAPPN